jgi:type II secretory pathway component PulF
MRPSERAWVALGVGVIAYELLARDGELLSHQVDRWLDRHPIITTAAIAVTSAHLLNFLPQRLDPWAWAFAWRPLVR